MVWYDCGTFFDRIHSILAWYQEQLETICAIGLIFASSTNPGAEMGLKLTYLHSTIDSSFKPVADGTRIQEHPRQC